MIGEKIKNIRLFLGRSQAEFAQLLKINPSQLSKIEKSKMSPGTEVLMRIFETTKMSPNKFFEGTEEEILNQSTTSSCIN